MVRNVKIQICLSVVILSMALSGCGMEYGAEGVPDNVKEEYALFDSYVDEYGNKGIVGDIYNAPDGSLGYIIILSADETEDQWGPTDEAVFRSGENFNKEYLLGCLFGLEMNQMVEQLGADRFPAFRWCHEKNGDGRPIHSSSWILPAYSELAWIFGNGIERLNEALDGIGGEPISQDGYYWSAVEDIRDAFHFSDGTLPGNFDFDQARRAVPMTADRMFPVDKIYWSKVYSYRVRAIKYIYFSCWPKDRYDSDQSMMTNGAQ